MQGPHSLEMGHGGFQIIPHLPHICRKYWIQLIQLIQIIYKTTYLRRHKHTWVLKWQKIHTTLLHSGLLCSLDFVHKMQDEVFLLESVGAQIRYVLSAILTKSSSLYPPDLMPSTICCIDSTINLLSIDARSSWSTLTWKCEINTSW